MCKTRLAKGSIKKPLGKIVLNFTTFLFQLAFKLMNYTVFRSITMA